MKKGRRERSDEGEVREARAEEVQEADGHPDAGVASL